MSNILFSNMLIFCCIYSVIHELCAFFCDFEVVDLADHESDRFLKKKMLPLVFFKNMPIKIAIKLIKQSFEAAKKILFVPLHIIDIERTNGAEDVSILHCSESALCSEYNS